jgi:DNA polymerase I
MKGMETPSSEIQTSISINTDIYVFLNTLKSYAKLFNSNNIYVAWDKRISRDGPNFRKIQCDGYKSTRSESNKEVYDCEQYLALFLKALNIKCIYPYTLEADDVIAYLSHTLPKPITIVSADNDLLQLVTSEVSVYLPTKKVLVTPNNFKQITDVDLNHFLRYKAILGDASDNIKGLAGFGKVKSKKLAENFEEASQSLTIDQLSIINDNMRLMDLSVGYKLEGSDEVNAYNRQLAELSDNTLNLPAFQDLCETYNLNSFSDNLNEWERIFKPSKLLSILEKFAE